MKALVSFCKLESNVFAKFAVRLKSQSVQYKAITLRNNIDEGVLMECTAIVLLPKYEFFTLAQITQYLIIYTPTMKLISRPNLSLWELLH